jgi:hypothetical protein
VFVQQWHSYALTYPAVLRFLWWTSNKWPTQKEGEGSVCVGG